MEKKKREKKDINQEKGGVMKILYLSHSGFQFTGSKVVLIDPFLTGNPLAPTGPDRFEKVDFIVITHDHSDHLGDSYTIAKQKGAVIVSQHEIAVKAQEQGIEAEGMNIGGPVERDGVKFWFTLALHTAGIGHSMGAVIEMDGKRIYHAGDTGIFSDMKLIGELFKPDIGFLPIGGRYTMDEEQAAMAVDFLKIPVIVPMHYKTFPLIKGDPEKFARIVGDTAKVKIMNPGDEIEI